MIGNWLIIKISNVLESLEVKILKIRGLRRLWIGILTFKLAASKSVTRYLSDNSVYWIDPRKIVFAMNSGGFYQDSPAYENKIPDDKRLYQYAGIGGYQNRLERKLEVNPNRCSGRVVGGDWDSLERQFSEIDFYRSYEERVLKGTRWEQLPYYKRVLWQIENGDKKWGCRDKQDLDKRCDTLDKIFNDIKQNGYKSRSMLRIELGKDSSLDDDEISVNIGRHGDYIFNNGRHRLTFAKLAGVNKVPVTITIRHSEWEKFKQEIEARVGNDSGLYVPLTHIDLQNLPVRQSQARFEMIKRNIGQGNRTLLDIGSRWGYFCHKFEDEGFHCTAVENDPENLYFLKKLRRSGNREFEIIEDSVLTLSNRGPLKFDVVLALEVWHHFLKNESSIMELTKLISNLDMKELYYESNVYDEAQAEGSFTKITPEGFIKNLIDNSCLKYYRMIGEYEEGRSIYKLWR